VITKTQTGFYILTGGGVVEEEEQSPHSMSRINRRSPKNKPKQKGKSLLTHTEEIPE
jgi:hypothetical protein